MPPPRSRWILPIIVFSQFSATSLWFAGNAVLDDLGIKWQLPVDSLGAITSAVQLGFIFGTLVFAFLSIPDRFSPRKIFLICAILGALANAAVTVLFKSYWVLLCCRFMTGFFLAGLYPIGMKIAAGWYQKDLGKAIGFLVAALVVGTAFPHLLHSFDSHWSWSTVINAVSCLAVFGGLLQFFLVVDGPYLTQGTQFNPKALVTIFRSRDFRASAFGYFGHCWELYAFWTFVPVFLTAHLHTMNYQELNIPLWTFSVIAVGSLGCALGGLLSQRFGNVRIAFYQLTASGTCCLLSPLIFFAPTPLFLIFLLFWGITVVGDSPQFSTLNAATAPVNLVGSALTIANCIGFSITIVSIKLVEYLSSWLEPHLLFSVLILGPLFGLGFMKPLLDQQ